MQNRFEQTEIKLVNKIYKIFLIKFEGNKTKFAKAALCSETTIRRVFSSKQRMTLDLFLRFCYALEINVQQIFREIEND
jgi:hypothetical protein